MSKFKRFAALFAVVIIISLYIATLVLAIMNNSYTKKFFMISLYSSVFIPGVMYLFNWLSNIFKDKKDSKEK